MKKLYPTSPAVRPLVALLASIRKAAKQTACTGDFAVMIITDLTAIARSIRRKEFRVAADGSLQTCEATCYADDDPDQAGFASLLLDLAFNLTLGGFKRNDRKAIAGCLMQLAREVKSG